VCVCVCVRARACMCMCAHTFVGYSYMCLLGIILCICVYLYFVSDFLVQYTDTVLLLLPCICFPTPLEANAVVAGVKRRFPQAELVPAETESDMIREVRSFRDQIRRTIPDINLDAARIDSCVNGYGMNYPCLWYKPVKNIM